MPSSRILTSDSKISLTTIGASPSEGSSTRRSFGSPTRARPIASICCSPPESVLPSCRRRSPSRGNSAIARSSRRCRSAPLCHRLNRPSVRFSSTLSVPKMRRSSGNEGDALAEDAVGRQPADALAVERDRAGRRPQPAHDGAQRRGLAGAVAAEDADDLAGIHRKRDARSTGAKAYCACSASTSSSGIDRTRDRPAGPPGWRAPRSACLRTASAPGASPSRGRTGSSPDRCRARSAARSRGRRAT